jgi:hypothetical protein
MSRNRVHQSIGMEGSLCQFDRREWMETGLLVHGRGRTQIDRVQGINVVKSKEVTNLMSKRCRKAVTFGAGKVDTDIEDRREEGPEKGEE